MKRRIKHVTVLGSGIMGSGIAAHFANIGVEVSLLDIVPFELTEAEQKKGLTKDDKAVRNRIASENFENLKKQVLHFFIHQSLQTESKSEISMTIYRKSKTQTGSLKW